MKVDELAAQLERDYWSDTQRRVAVGAPPGEEETVAANVHLPALARKTARAAARWGRRAGRPGRFQPAFVADTVAQAAEHSVRADPACGILIETIGVLLLRSLLENLAWRFAVWLLSDSTHEDRPDLLCRMAADND